MLYADVIVPLALNQLFTYEVPQLYAEKIAVGQRVVVQFGSKRLYSAIVRRLHSQKPEYETKEILSILELQPIVNERNLQFWEWIAQYYMASIGEVMAAALPVSLRLESETQVCLSDFYDTEQLNEQEKKIVEWLKHKKNATVAWLLKFFPQKSALKQVYNLVEKNIIEVYEALGQNYKPRLEKYVKISHLIKSSDDLIQIFNQLRRAKNQTLLLSAYCALSKLNFVGDKVFYQEVKREDLLKKAELKSDTLQKLYEKGILVEYTKEVSRFGEFNIDNKITKELNDIQNQALQSIKAQFEKHNTVLLLGVTSSGKTEIYIKLIEEYINRGKQVLYLLPEIALTIQIIQRLRLAFGDRVGIYHSRFDDNQRAEVWLKFIDNKQKRYDIILGVRSAIFLPFDNLGLIIVDEEHENTFKQQNPSPRYNARDCAVYLSKIFGAKILLGSATPSLESYYNSQISKYGYVELLQRFRDVQMPQIQIVDIKEAQKNKKMKSIFHQLMIENIKQALDSNEQVVLFQNRRGFAPYVQCANCGETVRCDNCDVSMTYHIDINQLVCHYCGAKQKIPRNCLYCGETHLKTRNFGTQKIEDEIKIFFPNARVARLDIDVSRRKNAYDNIINNFNEHKIDILIGTQMITKGLDFANVSFVGVLDADNLLNYPDFRSFERTFQLITQVSGRAGRSQSNGKVLIQTTQPNHNILKFIQKYQFRTFYEYELNERLRYQYPPFVKLIKINIKHTDRQKVYDFAMQLSELLRFKLKTMFFGCYEPLVGKIKNYYYYEILLKIPLDKNLAQIKQFIIDTATGLKNHKNFSNVAVLYNVDPL